MVVVEAMDLVDLEVGLTSLELSSWVNWSCASSLLQG